MKRALLLLSLLLLPTGVFAQSSVYTRNDTAATTLQSTNLQSSKAAVDLKGRLFTSISEGTNVATVRDTGASDSLNVAIVDAAGAQVTTFGGGTQYTEGDVDATITGTAAMWEDAGNVMTPISAAKPLPIDITDATLAVTQSGTWNVNNVSGTVSLPTGAATAANQTTEITALQLIDNIVSGSGVNVSAINGVTPLMGNGVTGTGSQRVTVASDNTPFPVKVDQTTPGTTNAVSVAQLGANAVSVGNGVSGTGVQRVTIASDSTGSLTVNAGLNLNTSALSTSANQTTEITSLQLLDNIVSGSGVNVSQINGVTPLMGNGVTGTGSHRVTVASDNTPFAVKIDQTTPGTTNKVSIGTDGLVGISANAANGYTKYSFGALVGTVQTVKGSAGTIGGYYIFNSAATVCYLQIFDTAGAVTLGTTVPDLSLGLPAGAAANISPVAPGILFSAGIKIAATTTRSNSTACGTGMDINIYYK